VTGLSRLAGGDTLSQEADQPAAEIRALWRDGRIEEARLALVHETQHSVFRFLKAMVRDEDIAQDLTQDTFVRAFQSLGSFRGESRVTTWILAIARNVALNRSRRMRLEQRWQQLTDRPPDVADPRVVPEPGEHGLTAALAALPSVQREAIVLYYVEDLGIEDVARITERPANTVKSDLRRARAALRAVLEERQDPTTGVDEWGVTR
jgi:RNA polymerase sigma-70 factor (ECF subfamily)